MPKYESAGEIIIEEKKVDRREKYRPEKPTGPETSVEELTGKITRVFVGQELKKSLESRYEEIRSMDPEELIPIYHGCRSGFVEAISNVQSYQGGVRQFKYYHSSSGDNNATFSLIPVSVYWNGIDRGGLKMYVPRKELALPGESYDDKRVVLIETPEVNGKPVVNSDVGVVGIVGGATDSYLSLLDLEGEIAVGEHTEVDKESAEKIIELNGKFVAIREHLKSSREKIISTLDKIAQALKDIPEANKLLGDRIGDRKYKVLTMPLVANRVLDQTISLTADSLEKKTETLKNAKEQELENSQAEASKVQPNIDHLIDALRNYQESIGLWAKISGKKSKTLEHLEKTLAEIREEYPGIHLPSYEKAGLKKEDIATIYAEKLIKLLDGVILSFKEKNQQLEQEISRYKRLAAFLKELQEDSEKFITSYQEAIKPSK